MIRLLSFTGLIMLIIYTSSCARVLRQGGGAKKNKPNTNNAPAGSTTNTTNASVATLKNIVFNTAQDYTGANQQLALDIYKPKETEGKKFPAIFLVHGGGFMNGDKSGLASTATKLASNGYVVISINYRLGFKISARNSCADSNSLKQAIYRSVQDCWSAINYVTQRADEYNIDNDWIFIGGGSAGAIAALTTAYLTKTDTDKLFPDFIAGMGALNNNEQNNFKIRGVISMWGAFIDPELITAKTALPTIFFQGELDQTVPFKSRPFAPCQSATKIYGTYPLYNRLKSLGVTAIAHVDPQGGHGVFTEDFRVNNILCFLNDVRQGITKQVYLTGVQNSCDK